MKGKENLQYFGTGGTTAPASTQMTSGEPLASLLSDTTARMGFRDRQEARHADKGGTTRFWRGSGRRAQPYLSQQKGVFTLLVVSLTVIQP